MLAAPLEQQAKAVAGKEVACACTQIYTPWSVYRICWAKSHFPVLACQIYVDFGIV